MTTRTVKLGGTDWSDGEVLYAADLNDTEDAQVGEGISITAQTSASAEDNSIFLDSSDTEIKSKDNSSVVRNVGHDFDYVLAGKGTIPLGTTTITYETLTVGEMLNGKTLYFYFYVDTGAYNSTSNILGVYVNDALQDSVSAGTSSNTEEFGISSGALSTDDVVTIKRTNSGGQNNGNYKYFALGLIAPDRALK